MTNKSTLEQKVKHKWLLSTFISCEPPLSEASGLIAGKSLSWRQSPTLTKWEVRVHLIVPHWQYRGLSTSQHLWGEVLSTEPRSKRGWALREAKEFIASLKLSLSGSDVSGSCSATADSWAPPLAVSCDGRDTSRASSHCSRVIGGVIICRCVSCLWVLIRAHLVHPGG